MGSILFAQVLNKSELCDLILLCADGKGLKLTYFEIFLKREKGARRTIGQRGRFEDYVRLRSRTYYVLT